MKLSLIAIATFIIVSTFTAIATADDTVTFAPDVIVGQVKVPTKGKHWTCTVQDLSQGSGQVRFCHWVKK